MSSDGEAGRCQCDAGLDSAKKMSVTDHDQLEPTWKT